MARRKRTFGQKIQQSEKHIFVGRQEQIELFQNNLNIGPDSDDFLNIFNVFGQGGVGKTTLVERRYRPLCNAKGYATAFMDTEDQRLREVTATMSSLAEQLDKDGGNFKAFHQKYKAYQQEKGKLEADPERPKGTFGSIVRESIKWGSKAGREALPGGNILIPDSFIDTGARIGGEWADFVARRLTNKDEVELVLQPIKVLSPLWVKAFNELADQKNIALFFDTYETANPQLDTWLYELLRERHGEIPPNFILCISGRHPLQPQRWNKFKTYAQNISLEPFTEAEARAYLQQRNLHNENAIQQILAISNCLPVYLSLLAEGDPASQDNIADPNEKVVARFLQHIKDPQQRQLALQAALPRKLNKDIVACLLPETADAAIAFDWLISRPFVQKRGGHWAYHPVVREMMLRHLRERSLKDWEQYHQQLAHYFQNRCHKLQTTADEERFQEADWRTERIERHYHLLCIHYKKQLSELMEDVMTIFRTAQIADATPYAVTLREVEKNKHISSDWSNLLSIGIAGILANDKEQAFPFFYKVNQNQLLQTIDNQANSYFGEGVYSSSPTDAIKCYQEAIDIKPDDDAAWNNMGYAYDDLGQKDKAIDFKPDDDAAYNSLGWLYLTQEEYKKAQTTLTKASKLPNITYYLPMNLGHTSLLQNSPDAAIEWYQKAIALSQNNIALNEFFEGMKQDYADLKMQDRGITKEQYQHIITQLQKEINLEL